MRGGPQTGLCTSCFAPASSMLSPLGLPIYRYSEFLDTESENLISEPDLAAGMAEQADAGALRYFGRGTLPDGNVGREILERYKLAARETVRVIAGTLANSRPDVAVFHHGIYVPQGVIGTVMRKVGVPVVNWGPAYRKSTVLFSHGDSYHHTMVDEPYDQWAKEPWTPFDEARILDYLSSRWNGGNDWISFQAIDAQGVDGLAKHLSLDPTLPIIGLLTNVIWDAQLHFRASAFPSMLEWLFATIDYFIAHPQLQLVIRVHPAEVLGTVPSRQCAADEIERRFGALPKHIKIVGPAEKISTYALMSLCDSALIYGTKTGLELACTGQPVVVAGDAWCRGKGFTIDVESEAEYLTVLDRLPFKGPISEEQVSEARRYAHHFFFRRMIPVDTLRPDHMFGPYSINVQSLDELRPGADRGLDVICDGILNGTPFVYTP